MESLIMVAQLILGLSILVGLHELGHLLAARLFGMRVEKYSIGFPPKIFGLKIGETTYSIGALPLGGYVKISGMIDESLDTQHLSTAAKPWEYRSKPAWQRLIVMLGGIIVNILTGIILFIGLTYSYEEQYYAAEEVNKYGIYPSAFGEELGFEKGDKILKVNGKTYNRFSDLTAPDVLLETNSYYTVLRETAEATIQMPANFIDRLSDKDVDRNFISPLIPFKVGKLLPDGNAAKAGLLEGDRIIAIDNIPTPYFQDFRLTIHQRAGELIKLDILRNNDTIALTPLVTQEGTIGFVANYQLNVSSYRYSLGESIVQGTKKAFSIVTIQLKAFGKIFSGEASASKSLSGPIGIAQIFGGVWQWQRFWLITGMLSMVLAFMNLLPIPALDGGHVVFLLYEMVSGKTASTKVLMGAQKIGIVLLLLLTAFAFGNDFYRWVLN